MKTDDMKDKARELGKQTQEKAGWVAEQAREQATTLAGQAQEKVKKKLDEQKERGMEELSSLAQAVRCTSQQLREDHKEGMAHYIDRTAEQLDRVIHYVESRNIGDLLEETETFARRHPEVFLGGAFVMGILVGRFMKSSQTSRTTHPHLPWEESAATPATPKIG
jgi:ElaB/YqjD/DUF883 family membrane-anchored ribosome-binding protein